MLGKSSHTFTPQKCDPSVQITSSPALRQLLLMLMAKMIGQNSCPLTVTVTATAQERVCELDLRWEATEAGHRVADAFALSCAGIGWERGELLTQLRVKCRLESGIQSDQHIMRRD